MCLVRPGNASSPSLTLAATSGIAAAGASEIAPDNTSVPVRFDSVGLDTVEESEPDGASLNVPDNSGLDGIEGLRVVAVEVPELVEL
jgi:hypothetical protein